MDEPANGDAPPPPAGPSEARPPPPPPAAGVHASFLDEAARLVATAVSRQGGKGKGGKVREWGKGGGGGRARRGDDDVLITPPPPPTPLPSSL